MRNHSYSLFLILFLLIGTGTSCEKEGCMDQNATNYDPAAEVPDGSCTFPPYVYVPDTLCDPPCENGGHCEENECQCPDRWTGTHCEKQSTPDSIMITKITVYSYPAHPGAGWDAEGGCSGPPEVYPVLIDSSGAYFYLGYNYDPFPVEVGDGSFALASTKDVTGLHTVKLMDHDREDNVFTCFPNDFMGKASRYIYTADNNFPDSLMFANADSTVKVMLQLEYAF